MIAVAVLAAALAAVLSYRVLEGWSPRILAAAGCRALGWGTVTGLLLNASCPGSPAGSRPLVLLDASLSMTAAGGRWPEALRLARAAGEVRFVGAAGADTTPAAGRSRMAPAILAARSSGRPVTVITDGEIEDAADLSPEVLSGVTVRVLPRAKVADAAIVRAEGPERVTAGDSLAFDIEVAASGGGATSRLALEAREGDRVWYRGSVQLDSAGRARTTLGGPLPDVPAGVHALSIRLLDARDPEPRDDARLRLVTILPTPGIVLLASPPGWESRFLLEALRDVAALPVRGYLEIEAGKWRRSGDLRVVPTDEVAQAASRADVLVTLGEVGSLARRAKAHGRWRWIPGSGRPGGDADWYLTPGPASPIQGAFVGLPADSFPPGTALADLTPGPRDWVGLTAQAGRRGTVRPALIGRDSAGSRIVVTGVEGLWRWAFRGGSSEQGYRGMVSSALSWLLAGSDSGAARLRAREPVAQRGRPVQFEWPGAGRPAGVVVDFTAGAVSRRDTLAFDGAGRAEVLLPPGVWHYRAAGAGEGTVGVEEYSDEWLASAATLTERAAASAPEPTRRPLRGWPWLFGIAVAGFAGEWFVRRRLGLR